MLVVPFVLAAAAAAAPARAQSDNQARAEAKTAFEHGVADYEAGRYEQALQSFQEAYRLRPHPLVNVNIANCYDKLNKPVQALSHFQQFLSSDIGTPEQRNEVTTAVARLKQQVGEILLRISPEGATVVIDQGEARQAPLTEPVELEAGKHTIEVRLQGYRGAERMLFIKGGTTLELTIALQPEAGTEAAPVAAAEAAQPEAQSPPVPAPAPLEPEAAPPSEAAAAPAAAHGRPVPIGVWVTGGLAVVLTATAVVTGSLALKANSDFQTQRTGRFDPNATALERIVSFNNAQDAASRARALALTTDILLAGAAVCGAVTVVLLVNRAHSGEADTPAARLSPMLGRDGGGLALHAQF